MKSNLTVSEILIRFREFARHNDADKKINDDITWDDWRKYDQEQLAEAERQLNELIREAVIRELEQFKTKHTSAKVGWFADIDEPELESRIKKLTISARVEELEQLLTAKGKSTRRYIKEPSAHVINRIAHLKQTEVKDE